jgi:uncharacterized surface protein with fasciclin (FAS1) repeats
MNKVFKLGAIILPLLLIQGCSSDDDNNAPVTVDPQPAVSVFDAAQDSGEFTTLVAALEATGLDETLDDLTNSYTVFAPTDDAFEAIGSGFLNTLLANPTVLADVLKQHVLVGSVDSVTAMSLNGQSAETLLGNTLPIAINADTNMLSFGGANIIVKDIMTSNGVIHVIDSVIISDVTLPQSAGTIADIASANGNFTTLIAALTATGLDTLVADPDNTFSVFAPTDDAFAALGQDTINALLADTDTLRDILLYHVFPDATVLSDDAVAIANSNSNKVEMANGDMAAISYVNSSLFINDSAITEANVTASNGVIHVLNKVIMPPAEVGTPTKTIATVATETPALSTLVTALQAAGLVDTFNDTTQSFTVFAPTNAAFSKIPSADLDALLADTAALTGVLTQHVLGA